MCVLYAVFCALCALIEWLRDSGTEYDDALDGAQVGGRSLDCVIAESVGHDDDVDFDRGSSLVEGLLGEHQCLADGRDARVVGQL